LILIFGFILSIVFFNEVVLGTPIVDVLWPICLCKFVKSTVSESNNPIVPTPAADKYMAKGHPIPPEPINAIFEQTILCCPSYEIYFNSICLEYLLINYVFKGYSIFILKGYTLFFYYLISYLCWSFFLL